MDGGATTEESELDWRYLSSTHTSENDYYSSAISEEEEDEDYYNNNNHQHQQDLDRALGQTLGGGSTFNNNTNNNNPLTLTESQLQQSLPYRTRTRPLLVPSSSHSSSLSTQHQKQSSSFVSASSPSASSSGLFLSTSHQQHHEADDSTDTIKSMRARALDKINGRSSDLASSPVRSTNQGTGINNNNNNNNNSGTTGHYTNNNSSTFATTPSIAKRVGPTTFSHNSNSTNPTPVRSSTTIIATTTPQEASSSRLKKKSLGLASSVERSATLPRMSTKPSSSQPDAQYPNVRKRASGSFKTQNQAQAQSQQQSVTSDDDQEPPAHNVFTDRNRYAVEGGVAGTGGGGLLASELKALKARVQELEMERMNRSLSTIAVHGPQSITPQSFQSQQQSLQEEQQVSSHSEKLQHLQQKHPHRPPTSGDNNTSSHLRSPVSSYSATLANRSTDTVRSGMRLDPPAAIASPVNGQSAASATPQHVVLLKDAFRTFEKLAASLYGNSLTVTSMSKVVSSALSMNHTIRMLIKADVNLVDSSSMNALQRASDEQIRSLTESLLTLTTPQQQQQQQQQQSAPDKTPSPANGGGNMAMNRPESPRHSTLHRLGQGAQGQRSLSLAMAGHELGALPPYPMRPQSAAAMSHYESTGTAVIPMTMSSSGYLNRPDSIISASLSDLRSKGNGQERPRTISGGLSQSRLSQNSESSMRQEQHSTLSQRRQVQLPSLHQPQPRQSYVSPRASISPGPHPARSSRILSSESAGSMTRRQASVQNILMRFSQASPKSPGFGPAEEEETSIPHSMSLGLGIDQGGQSGGSHGGQGSESGQSEHEHYAHNSRMTQSSVSFMNFGSIGRLGSMAGPRRPLSQQENRSFARSPVPGTQFRQGNVVQRPGRYAHDNVFSEDESSGWGRMSVAEQVGSRSNKTGAYTAQLQQFRGRHEQQQQDQQRAQQQYTEQVHHTGLREEAERQNDHQSLYSDGAESEAYTEDRQSDQGRVRRRLLSFPRQQHMQGISEVQLQHQDQQQQQQQHLHHPDMMMTNPAMPSPTSSPSSSSRVDGPSVISNHGYQSGVSGSDSRYHLSPRGPTGTATFPRQQSVSSITSFGEEGSYLEDQQLQQQQRHQDQLQSRKGVAAFPQDNLSAQAKARLQHILGAQAQ
ncbi:hypothetical protein BGZ83_007782 [Gryganskiella cystojenkinii]|nr:hypothetical protein BGZ83_007782 [Gryganskiella cystojenkinii]